MGLGVLQAHKELFSCNGGWRASPATPCYTKRETEAQRGRSSLAAAQLSVWQGQGRARELSWAD